MKLAIPPEMELTLELSFLLCVCVHLKFVKQLNNGLYYGSSEWVGIGTKCSRLVDRM